MYEQFFELRERPFDLVPDPRFLVLTDGHAEALSTLEYAISSRKGVTLLTGEAGLGKTTLLRTAIDRQSERVHCVYMQNPALSRTEFVELLARRFGLSKEAGASKTTMLFELEELLTRARNNGDTTLLVIDEGQSLPLELLEEVRLLANIETANDRLLSLIIAGQPELADRLNDPRLRQFKQRVALRCELRPLTREETTAYVAGRIAAAGGAGGQVFTREAVSEIHKRSGGVPRTVSVIADNALLGGYAAGERPVRAAIVREVCRDLDLPEPPRAQTGGTAPDGLPPSNGFRPERPVAAEAAAQFRMLRARVSLPSEADIPAGHEAAGEPKAAVAGDRPMFGGFMKKRRFLFFRR
jgi:type II secretory pathway predicted ATPase ExeA